MNIRICLFLIGLITFTSRCFALNGGETDNITPEIVAVVTDAPPTTAPAQPTDTPLPPPPTLPAEVSDENADLLPDLAVGSVSITLEPPFTCLEENDALGIEVWVANLGSIPVSQFELNINGQTTIFENELIPGDQGSIWVEGSTTQVAIELDPNNLVAESDEANNQFDELVPIPTAPPACTATPEPKPATAPVDAIELEWVAGGLAKPLFVTHAFDERMFVVEQQGTIRVITPDGAVGNNPFLNIIDRTNSSRNEQGLLGLAFHPNYQQNGRFFVNYTHADGSTVVSEFRISADPNVADSGSERQIIKIAQPYANHNGGMIAFGPDGYLYIGMGDGGSQNDPENRAQNLNELLGKILRIDIDGAEPYGIPADNPFITNDAARNEIWSVGWRNPWRFNFDRETGNMFIGDVGQNEIEEISFNPAGVGGLNFGWRIFEGNECYLDDCSTASLEPAIAQYDHVDGHCSVTGGYMHRGTENVSLNGNYFFADYCSSQMWRLYPAEDGSFDMVPLNRPGFFISSFGEDINGEIYLTNQIGGEIYKIVPAEQ